MAKLPPYTSTGEYIWHYTLSLHLRIDLSIFDPANHCGFAAVIQC